MQLSEGLGLGQLLPPQLGTQQPLHLHRHTGVIPGNELHSHPAKSNILIQRQKLTGLALLWFFNTAPTTLREIHHCKQAVQTPLPPARLTLVGSDRGFVHVAEPLE